jgi:hypothetical protein
MIVTATQSLQSTQWGSGQTSGTTPLWELAIAIAVCVLILLCLVAAAVVALRGTPRSDDDEQGDGGPGGRGPERPPPEDRGPEGDPAWWPEFERQFAAYVEVVASPG